MERRKCLQCNKIFFYKKSENAKYCSRKCFFKSIKGVIRKTLSDECINDYKNGMPIEEILMKYDISNWTFWVRKKELGLNRINSPIKVPINFSDSKELWYVVGALKGDGWISISKRIGRRNSYYYEIGLAVKDNEFANEFFECCKSIGLKPYFTTKKAGTKQGFVWRIIAKNKGFCNWYKKINYEEIECLKEEHKIAFIRGFFDSEGSVSCDNRKEFYKVRISNTKMDLINLIRHLLSSLEFKSSIYPAMKLIKNKRFKCYDIYLLGGKAKSQEFLTLVQPSIPRKTWKYNHQKYINPIEGGQNSILE